ncbi:MAG: hypothetical protein M3R06_05390 [Chloroflexota bacterium]|nr:hypothetical protein [Chloroflexota bacterium]
MKYLRYVVGLGSGVAVLWGLLFKRRSVLAPGLEPVAAEIPAGAVAGDGTTSCPAKYPVKGNATSMIFHSPGGVSYDQTIANFCFSTSEAAETAGYRASLR